jgi:hypothetical protein
MQDILEEERAEQERKREEAERPIREAQAKLSETHRKLYEIEKAEVIAGRPDPGWELPASAADLSMPLDEAKAFAQREAEAYRQQHPEYHPTGKNFERIKSYLSAQGVVIPDRACFAQAVQRLTYFGLLEERPAPAAQPVQIEEPQEPNVPTEAPSEEPLVGWDLNTGVERVFTKREVDRMSAEEFKRTFRLCVTRDGDRRPKFNRSRYQ